MDVTLNDNPGTPSTSGGDAGGASGAPAAAPASGGANAGASTTPGGETAGQGAASGTAATEGSPSPAADGTVTPAPFKPRDKFKVRNVDTDTQDEHDVPEWIKGYVKDAETEKQALALLEKAYGLEPVKQSRKQVQEERDKYRNDFNGVISQIGKARTTFQRGDIDGWLAMLNIPAERMLQWAYEKVEYSKLTPEQRASFDQRVDAQRRAWTAEEQAAHLQNQSFEQARSVKQQLLQSSLARPDIKTFAEAFDAKAGKPGAFQEEVRATGEHEWHRSEGKTDLSPDQAIELVMSKWKPFLQIGTPAAPAAPAPGVSASAAGSQGGAVNPSAQTTVIPNVQGKGTSPLKGKPKSLADLQKLKEQVLASS